MRKIVLLIYCTLFLVGGLEAQSTKVIKGQVFDERDDKPLGRAVLIHPSSKLGGVAGANGSFRIEIPDSINHLIISYLGYYPKILNLDCNDCEYKVYLLKEIPIEEEIIYAYSIDKHPYSSLQSIHPDIFNTGDGTSVSSILNTVPGVYMHAGTLNTNRITIRGIGGRSASDTRNIKAYYNDIPIISSDKESFIEDFDLNTLDNITVLKGPSGSTFGAPLGGAILLNNGYFGGSNFTSDFSVGSFDLWRTTNRLKLHEANYLFQVYQSNTHSEGYRKNNSFDRKSIGFSGQYRLNKHTFSIIGNNINLTAERPSSIDSVTYATNPTLAAPEWEETHANEDYGTAVFGINYKYESSFDNGLEMSVSNSLYANLKENYEIKPYDILSENAQNGGLRSFLKLTKAFEIWSFDYSIGTEILIERHAWQTFENETHGIQGALQTDLLENNQFVNIFNELEIKHKDFSIVAGLNSNKTVYSIKNQNPFDTTNQNLTHEYDWIASPKLGVSYNFETFYIADLSVYSNISHGFSMPSSSETLQPLGVLNTNLKPELGWSFEVGTRGSLLDGRVLYDFTIYQMNIKNLIVTQKTNDNLPIGVNAGKTHQEGFELFFQYKQPFFLSQEIIFSSTYTANNFTFTEFVDDGSDYGGNLLPGVPKDICHIQINWDGKKKLPFFASVSSLIVDEMPMNDANTAFSEKYWITNFKAGYQKEYRKMKLNMYMGINNLLNKKYASMISVNADRLNSNLPPYYHAGLPRNYYFGMKVSVDF